MAEGLRRDGPFRRWGNSARGPHHKSRYRAGGVRAGGGREDALGQARQVVEQQADLCCQQIGIERC
jgi:hypothetical protein